MEPSGYPSYVLYITLTIGILLALSKPYKAFLMVVFLISIADSVSFRYTRTSLLGPYFNANDACLLIAILASFIYGLKLKHKFQIPDIAKCMLAVLIIGFIQSLIAMGHVAYEVLRSFRWAISLPFYFIISATMVNNEKKVKQFLFILFLGAIVSAIEHIFFVNLLKQQYLYSDYLIEQIRTLAFRGPGLWFLLAGIVWFPKIKGLNSKILIFSGILFAASILLNQTRSIWISSILSIPIVFILFRQKKIFQKAITISLLVPVLYVGVLLIMHYMIPELKPDEIIMNRFGTFVDEISRFNTTITRQLAFEKEIEEWSNGSLVFGRGLFYFAPYYFNFIGYYRVAWGHLGHVTTLAQLGIIGFFVYSIFLPLRIIQLSRRIWNHTSQELKFLGLLSGVCIISSWLCFLMSDSFLSPHALEGVIFGATWRLAMNLITDQRKATLSNYLPAFLARSTQTNPRRTLC